MTISHFAKYQLPLLLWLLLIFGISAIPKMPTVKFPISPDKIAHAGIYFVLCMLGRRAFFHQEKWLWLRENAMLAAILFTVVYGTSDEVHQMYVPNRSADLYDGIADCVGALMYFGWHRFSVWRKR